MYGDGVLYHERVFSGGKGDKDAVYADWCVAGHSCGDGGKCGVDEDDAIELSFEKLKIQSISRINIKKIENNL